MGSHVGTNKGTHKTGIAEQKWKAQSPENPEKYTCAINVKHENVKLRKGFSAVVWDDRDLVNKGFPSKGEWVRPLSKKNIPEAESSLALSCQPVFIKLWRQWGAQHSAWATYKAFLSFIQEPGESVQLKVLVQGWWSPRLFLLPPREKMVK